MTDDGNEHTESLPEAIHRRGLWQVALGYLAVGWALIEVVDVLTSRGVLPESLFLGSLVLLLFGFPVVVATAYFQASPLAGDPGVRADARPREGVARHLTWRNAALGGIGSFTLLGVVTAGMTVLRVADVLPDAAAIDPDRVAILPFTVRGSGELEYLGEGIVDLMSVKLDGAGTLKASDPRAVIAAASGGEFDLSTPEGVHGLATELGAGRFVTGELIESGGNVRLTATIRNTEAQADEGLTATVEGTAGDIFGTLDRLAAALLAEVLEAEADRLQSLAAITTSSLEAAKEYLRGERLLRAASYREAGAAYERAVDLDSTFALAHYRKSVAADWTDAFDIRSSAETAMKYSGRLSSREQNLVRALSLRRNGDFPEAEQVFRAILHSNPHDVEALVQLGELLFHDVGRQGRSMWESLEPFQRAVELEPNNRIAHLHLARLYAAMDSTAQLSETAALVAASGDGGVRTTEIAALAAWAAGDSAQKGEVLDRLAGAGWYYWWYAGHAIGNFTRDYQAAEALLERRDSDSPVLQLLDTSFDVIRGRYDLVRESFARAARRGDPNWMMYEAFLLTSGAMPPDPERAGALSRELEPLTGEQILSSAWIPPYEDRTPRFEEFQRDYFRALLLIQAGRPDEAEAILGEMRTQDEFRGLGSLKRDAELAVEAELRLQRGNRRGALDALRQAEYRVPHAMVVRPMSELTGQRFLRGQLEQEFGDVETAATVFVAMDETWSLWDPQLRPHIYDRLGRIAEEAGRDTEAIAYYTRLLDLWSNADASLDGRRQEIGRRRDALLRATG